MPLNKYFNPKKYGTKIKHLLVKLVLSLGVSIRVVCRVDKFKITFITTSYIEYALRAQKSYEREKVTMHWLRYVIESEDVVYDIGANVGAYSLFAGYKVRTGGGRVYAFEPTYFNYFSLSRNIQENDLANIVIPYSLAVADLERERRLYLSSIVSGSALHGLGQTSSEGSEFIPQFQQGVYTISLDIFCAQDGVEFPNHVKIDVDGGEAAVIRGMQSIMKDSRLKSIMIEIDSDINGSTIETEIIGCGFQEELVESWQGKNVYNKLFVRNSRCND